MAKIDIKKMERVEKERNRIHEEARATYTTFQIDKESASLLIKLLQESF